MSTPMTSLLVLALLTSPAQARAQDRPAEEEIFGERASPDSFELPKSSSVAANRTASAATGPGKPGDASEPQRGDGAATPLLREIGSTDNLLQMGGLLYLRSNLSARENAPPGRWALSAPSLADVYLDARPSDRLRGFALGRMQFDPSQGSSAANAVGGVTLPGATTVSNPHVLLDQLWLQFDLDRTAFVTFGRQHDKWGVGHFWNPTDYLHPVQRNPLAVFDERTGTFMARVAVPWEARGWNFYGMAVFEPLATSAGSPAGVSLPQVSGQGQTTNSTTGAAGEASRLGAGARAEVVLGGWELGVDGVVQPGIRPRFGIDLSGGIWEIDVRSELALRTSSDVPLYRGPSAFSPATTTYEPHGIRPMALVGAEWTHKYSDSHTYSLGLEYFYNSNGYADATLYPLLLYNNAFTPFYLGRHYAGAFLLLPKPGSWNLHTFTLSLIANLSDRTGVGRLDWSMALLTHLTIEAYVQGHFGASGGEFRLALAVPPDTIPGFPAALVLGAPTVDVGLAFRLKI